jgi:hypothetical protein
MLTQTLVILGTRTGDILKIILVKIDSNSIGFNLTTMH